MTNRIVVGNLKMNLVRKEVSSYLKTANEKIKSKNVIICPTSIYIPYFLKHNYQVGLQNVFFRSKGAYTGEISAMQAKSMGINYTLIGHSERRIYFDELDSDINKKIKEAIKYKMKVILCIGETLEERNLLKTDRVIKRQIINGLRDIEDFSNIVIAYEPVWAIGTNVIPSNDDIFKVISYIKDLFKKVYNYDKIRVLYGGSINDENIKKLVEISNVDGFLVGGASTNIDKFLKIIEVAVKE